jgi:digeranylgeranylglycerophospholipid reductase
VKKQYDIIVVGGGPGGAWAAKHAADNGVSVLLLEKDEKIGIPVRCAEGVAKSSLCKLVSVRKEWIAQEVRDIRLVAPDGTEIDLASVKDGVIFNRRFFKRNLVAGEKGIILHRKIFDRDLAEMASKAGAEIHTGAYVYGLSFKNGAVTGVLVHMMGREHEIASSVVIGADGIESRVGRWGGLKTHVSPKGIGSCAQMTLSGIDIDPSRVFFYFGSHIAPKGYLWIFPKGKGTGNVGLGIIRNAVDSKTVLERLKTFVDSKFKNYTVQSCIAGGVPAVPTLKSIVGNGLMLIGDAARQADPVSGGGIYNAMKAGQIAGEVAAEAIHRGDVSKKRLTIYEKRWKKAEGKNIERSYRLMQAKNRFSDEDFNRIGRALIKMPQDKRTMVQIFKTAFLQHPKLIVDAVKFLT